MAELAGLCQKVDEMLTYYAYGHSRQQRPSLFRVYSARASSEGTRPITAVHSQEPPRGIIAAVHTLDPERSCAH